MEMKLEALLFAYGKPVKSSVLAKILEVPEKQVIDILENMKNDYSNRGIELISVQDSYTLVTKKEYYEDVIKLFETRSKPNLSNAAFEVLAIMAYNTNITKAEIEKIRGVNSDGTINKLMEYELIEETGRLDVPGRPITYKVSDNFFKLFGYSSLEELPKIDLEKENKEDEEKQVQDNNTRNFIQPTNEECINDSSNIKNNLEQSNQ